MVGLTREEFINCLRKGFNLETSLKLISDYCISKGKSSSKVDQLIMTLSQNPTMAVPIIQSITPELIRYFGIYTVFNKQNKSILYY